MRITKTTTKVGDKGMTSLGDGTKVPKNSLRIIAIGLLDEVNARVGFAKVKSPNKMVEKWLIEVQNNLFNLGGELALGENAKPIFPVKKVAEIELSIEKLNSQLPHLKDFILPGGDEFCSRLHLARTAIRQAEIAIITLKENASIRDCLQIYLNRLSDYFFVLARFHSLENKLPEFEWKHQKS